MKRGISKEGEEGEWREKKSKREGERRRGIEKDREERE